MSRSTSLMVWKGERRDGLKCLKFQSGSAAQLHPSYLDFVGAQVEELEILEALERLDRNRIEEVERQVQLHEVGQLWKGKQSFWRNVNRARAGRRTSTR